MSSALPQLSIVHLLAPARFGGLETVVTTLAAGQRAMGDRVAAGLVLKPSEAEDHPMIRTLEGADVEVRPIVVSGRDYAGEREATGALLEDVEADILHTHGYRPDVIDAPVARSRGIPTVTTVHGFTGGGWRGRLYEWLQKRSFRSFDAVIVVSRKIERELASKGVASSRLHRVQNAWRSQAGEALPRDVARSHLGLSDETVVVGWVGRMSPEKAPDVMIRAAAAVRSHAVWFSMIGAGAMEEECRALSEALEIGDRVRWHGVVPGASRLLSAFDLLVLSSWTEGTPMVLLEAMAASVPVVSTDVGGIPDVVGPAEAELCQAGRHDLIAAAIDRTLASPDEAARRARAARARLESDFAVEPWVDKHRAIYHSLIS
jgi:glycosyltransferase involved in cell wall biosynthesis